MGSEVATWTRPFLHELLEEIPKDVESLIDVVVAGALWGL
jgi:hypothetical protein